MRRKVNETTFEGKSFYIGIDVHLKAMKVTILGESQEHKTFSSNVDAGKLAAYLNRNFPGANFYAVYEAGFSGFTLQRDLTKLGVNCIVINPADLPVSHKDRQQKTDTRDSRALAKCLRAGVLEGIFIPDEVLEADRILTRHRFSLVKDLARFKNRVKSLLYFKGIQIPSNFTTNQTRRWTNNFIVWLDSIEDPNESFVLTLKNYIGIVQKFRSEVLKVTRQIRALSRSERYKHKSRLLIGVPGIGLISAMTILTQLGDINRFKKLDELCSYVGLIPKMYNSGDRTRDGKIVNRGRKELKIKLIEASWVAIRRDPALMAKYDELKKRMNKNKAIIRIARKLLSRIRHILQKNDVYEFGTVA